MWHCQGLSDYLKMTVVGSGSVHEKMRRTPVSLTALFSEKGLESQLPPAYPAVLLQPFVAIRTAWKNIRKKTVGLKVFGSTCRPGDIKRMRILTFLQ